MWSYIQTPKLNFFTKHNKTNIRILRIYNYNIKNSYTQHIIIIHLALKHTCDFLKASM